MMVYNMMNKIYRYLMVLGCAAFMLACEPSTYIGFEEIIIPNGGSSSKPESMRDYNKESRNVLLLYSAGYNSLSEYLAEDMGDLMSGDVPSSGRMNDILLIYSHQLASKGNYSVPTSPVLMHVYKQADGTVAKDTLEVYPAGTCSSSASQLNEVLTYVKDNYPAKSYGMIFSSHATGYLPLGYYTKPGDYIYTPASATCDLGAVQTFGKPMGVPYVEPEHDPSLPMVKSVGQDQVGTYGKYISYEIEIEDFARALPMYMDYILFDACLMGGIEVAYELAGRCGTVGFSQTEVLAEGFDYKTLPSHLLCGGTPDPAAVCEDYYRQYDVQSGVYRSATISIVDCSKVEPVAQVCARLFDKYRVALGEINPRDVQRYYRSDYHWFYDLVDIVAKAGAGAEELEELNSAIDACMIYKAATPEFMNSFKIRSYSGFSMYLPCNGSVELDRYYRTLKWNIATNLVE